jgi:hypothetical protein
VERGRRLDRTIGLCLLAINSADAFLLDFSLAAAAGNLRSSNDCRPKVYLAGMGRSCVSTFLETRFRDPQTITRMPIVDPGAFYEAEFIDDHSFSAFSHGLGRYHHYRYFWSGRSETLS